MNKRIILKILIVVLFVMVSVFVIFFVSDKRHMEGTDWKQIKDSKVKKETSQVNKVSLSNINMNKSSVYFYDTEWLTNYSQVEDGHYYWLRYNGNSGEYIIYRDNKKKMGAFAIPSLDDNDIPYCLDGFVKYEDDFYAIISHLDMKREEEDFEVQELARVDLEKGKLEILYDVSTEHVTGDGKFLFCCIYQDYFYYDRRTVWQSYDKRPGISVRLPLQGGTTEELQTSLNLTKAKPYLLYMDNKIFYSIKDNKRVTLFCYDLQSNKEQQFFQFEEKGKANIEQSFITMDKEYIYCMDYMISRKKNKAFKVFQEAKSGENGMLEYTSNSKYVFFLDKQNRIHRLDKKTRQDIIIREEKSLAVSCTEKNLYIRVRDKKGYNKCKNADTASDEYNGNSNDYYADDLYCVNFDGKEERKIWRGGYVE